LESKALKVKLLGTIPVIMFNAAEFH